MDEMKDIENKMQVMAQDCNENSAPIPAQEAPVSVALETAAASIVEKAREKINSDRIVDKHARALAKNADSRIANEIEKQNVLNEKSKAENVIDRKELANRLYAIKEESKRLKVQQRHLSRMQRAEQRAEKIHAYWEAHRETLEQYKMHEGSSRVACSILLFLDGVKCFFMGVSKVSDALIKALKYVLIFGGIFGVIMIIPSTRNWFLTLLGFIK